MSEMLDPAKIVGVAHSYEDLRRLLRERRQALGLRHLEVDEIAGIQPGYCGKLEIGTKNYGPMSLTCMLGALGVKIVLVRSAGAQTDLQAEAKASIENYKTVRKKLAAKGGRACARELTPDQRKRSARRAAKVRWRKWREAKAEKERRSKRQKRKDSAK